MMQLRTAKWLGLFLFVFALSTTTACKKRTYKVGNVAGSILVLQPATEQGRITKKFLDLKVKLYDTENIAHFKAIFQQKVIWEKSFPPGPTSEITLTKKLDLTKEKVLDGRSKILFILRDQEGGIVRSTLPVFLDRRGPEIEWQEPKVGQMLTHKTTAELRVTDAQGINWVKVIYDNKTLETFHTRPFQFQIDPSDYPTGNTTFWIQAKDKLGNLTVRSFTFMLPGAALGTPCSTGSSCKGRNICVKFRGASKGFCRKRCRYNQHCPAGFKCKRVQKYKVCMPPVYRTKSGKPLAGLFGRCSKKVPCGPQLQCIRFPNGRQSCRIQCGPGRRRCQKGFVCKKVAWTASKKKVHVCLQPPKQKVMERDIGETCDRKRPCVKNAMCVKAGNKPSKCYKKCGSRYDCPYGLQCNPVPGKKTKICINLPRSARKAEAVEAYQKCGSKIPCQKGLFCMSSSRNPTPRCFPICGSSHCGESHECLSIAGRSICLNTCVPNQASCPSGTGCRFVGQGRKNKYFCN